MPRAISLVFVLVACSDSSGPVLTVHGDGHANAPRLALDQGLSPSSHLVQMFGLWVSRSPLCTAPTPVFEIADPAWSDLLIEPTFGSGPVDLGTYPCIIGIINDTFRITPAESSDSGHCVAGVEFSGEMCREPYASLLPSGETVACRTGAPDRIAVYLSTAGAPVDMIRDPGHPPVSETDTAHGVKIEAPLVIREDTIATFYEDATGAMRDTGEACELGALPAGFR